MRKGCLLKKKKKKKIWIHEYTELETHSFLKKKERKEERKKKEKETGSLKMGDRAVASAWNPRLETLRAAGEHQAQPWTIQSLLSTSDSGSSESQAKPSPHPAVGESSTPARPCLLPPSIWAPLSMFQSAGHRSALGLSSFPGIPQSIPFSNHQF